MRVILYFADQCPIRFASVHLAACATMNSQFLDAAILKTLRKINYKRRTVGQIERVLIPSESGLSRNRCLHRIHDCLGNIQHLRHIPQKTCPCTLARHFLHRTAEIDIDEIRLGRFNNLRSLCHRLGFTPVDLNRYGPFLVMDSQFAGCGSDIAYQGIRIDKLPIRSVTLTEHSERRISDILHRSKIERLIFHSSASDKRYGDGSSPQGAR